MGVIKLPLPYTGTQGELNLYTLFDSGANYSCINAEWVNGLTIPQRIGHVRKLSTASESHYIEVTEVVRLDFYINDVLLSDEFLVVPGLSEEVIIGALTMQKWRIKLNFDKDCVEVDPKVAKLHLINLISR